MFNLPLPTDNLYKFVAIAGLTLCVIAYFFAGRSQDEMGKQRELLIRDSEAIEVGMAELEDLAIYFPRLRPPEAVGHHPNTNFDSSESFDYIQKSCQAIRDFCRQFSYPLTAEDKQLYLTDRKIRDTFKANRGLTDGEYEKWMQSLSVLDLQNLINKRAASIAQQVFVGARKFELDALHHQRLVDDASKDRYFACWCGCFGLGLMLIGFIFWYWKVQRYQDRLLRKEASKAQPAA